MSGRSKHYETPVVGKENKFVITENEAWFLPLEDGRILAGYVAKESREISIHNWPIDDDPDTETVKRRLKTVFPSARRFIGVEGNIYYL